MSFERDHAPPGAAWHPHRSMSALFPSVSGPQGAGTHQYKMLVGFNSSPQKNHCLLLYLRFLSTSARKLRVRVFSLFFLISLDPFGIREIGKVVSIFPTCQFFDVEKEKFSSFQFLLFELICPNFSMAYGMISLFLYI